MSDDLLANATEGSPAVQLANRAILSAIQQEANSIQIRNNQVYLDNEVLFAPPPQLIVGLLRRFCVMTDTIPIYAFEGTKTGRFEVLIQDKSWAFTCSFNYSEQSFICSVGNN